MHYLWNGVISMGILNVALSVYDGVPNLDLTHMPSVSEELPTKEYVNCCIVPTRVLQML